MNDCYSSSDSDFPNGVCTCCSIVLSNKRKDPTTALPIIESYNPERKTSLRLINTCSCKICSVAKLNGLEFLLVSWKNKWRRGRPTRKNYSWECKKLFHKEVAVIQHHNGSISVASISSPTTIQRAASYEQHFSEVTATLVSRSTILEEVKKVLFSSADCFCLQ